MTPRPFSIVTQATQYLRRSRVQLALSRAAATAPLRSLDATNPDSWEFSAFSAAGEDGIIDYLTRRMRDPEHVFLEVGASDGVANNTAWLAIARKWQGVMIEADPAAAARARATMRWFNPLVDVLELLVTEGNVDQVIAATATPRPDVLSVDIDGIDYYVTKALFEHGLRPRLCVVEYNSAYGPITGCTISPALASDSHERLYYGVSITGWRRFFHGYGYEFVGVERTGVNAFFADRKSFDREFLQGVRGIGFRENLSQRYAGPWQRQLQALERLKLVEIA